jgi:hypothetical protein
VNTLDEKVPVELRAILASGTAMVGLQSSESPTVNIAIVLVWLFGGLLEYLHSAKVKREQRKLESTRLRTGLTSGQQVKP